ncbi:hypothetical protein GCM10010166_45080 [Couchioplanes caeruleus subsp. azureus]|nr:hypothetical protein GCM10010166_45080 [Couchioplanes caeruleus subsp. azureus]
MGVPARMDNRDAVPLEMRLHRVRHTPANAGPAVPVPQSAGRSRTRRHRVAHAQDARLSRDLLATTSASVVRVERDSLYITVKVDQDEHRIHADNIVRSAPADRGRPRTTKSKRGQMPEGVVQESLF